MNKYICDEAIRCTFKTLEVKLEELDNAYTALGLREQQLAASQARVDELRKALTAVPSILYGLGIEDVRQAQVAQLAIEVCRAALRVEP